MVVRSRTAILAGLVMAAALGGCVAPETGEPGRSRDGEFDEPGELLDEGSGGGLAGTGGLGDDGDGTSGDGPSQGGRSTSSSGQGTSGSGSYVRSVGRAGTILFLHGLDPTGDPRASGADYEGWTEMYSALAGWGWGASSLVRLGYYVCDVGYSSAISAHENHETHTRGSLDHQGTGCGGQLKHDIDTSIEHLGYHLAWKVYDDYAASGACPSVIAHSMGGLITRYALARTAMRDPDFPASICIDRVVTFGTPHAGGQGTEFCSGDGYQCEELTPGSVFLNWLSSNAQNPQGGGGTKWILVASDDDFLVTSSSALAMSAAQKVVYLSEANVHHSSKCNYMDATCSQEKCDSDPKCFEYVPHGSDVRTAGVSYSENGGTSVLSKEAPWPVRWADLALAGDQVTWAPAWENSVPTLARVAPATAAVSLSTGQSVTFQARAEDIDEDLDYTAFYSNGVQEATDGCYYDCWYDEASWTASFNAAGTYEISARAFDEAGAQSNEVRWTVTVTPPQNHAPTLSRVSPGASVNINAGQSVTFQARAEDQDSNLNDTRFFIDGTHYGTDECWVDCGYDDASWTYTFNAAGTYAVTAQARDTNAAESNFVSWTVTVTQAGNSAPTLSITSPSSPVSISAGTSVTFRARAEDIDSNLDDTRFYLDGAYESTDECWYDCWYDDASWSKTFYYSGTYTVSAQARDDNGATSNVVEWTVYVS